MHRTAANREPPGPERHRAKRPGPGGEQGAPQPCPVPRGASHLSFTTARGRPGPEAGVGRPISQTRTPRRGEARLHPFVPGLEPCLTRARERPTCSSGGLGLSPRLPPARREHRRPRGGAGCGAEAKPALVPTTACPVHAWGRSTLAADEALPSSPDVGRSPRPSHNLRVRSGGGTEFFTRSATKFKGALAQKFMFVDGDRAICGSYSFTWSAARTDRNVISVLSGQVVEMFDRQFQELYLTSRGVSLKGIPMEKEPEPEPVVLHSVVPQAPSGATAKKLVNPKYALVKAKSADEIAKLSSEKQEASRALGVRDVALAKLPGDPPEPHLPIHPGLLNLERANMFAYLPTWVEPDPEPGSDILGYINIIDPNIWNPQPSQMNRIKIRDASRAGTQLWRQSQDSSPAPQPGPPQDGVPAENSLPPGDAEPRPPVPKPRTVPVADPLAQGGGGVGWALATPEGQAPRNRTDDGLPRTAGPGHAPLQCRLSVTQDDPDGGGPAVPNGLEGEEEEDDDDYVTLSEQDSLSGSSGRGPGPQRPLVASSSVSDECFEVTERSATLQRCHSEQVANGPAQPPCRQLGAPHMTRGTFGGPLGGSSWAQGQEREEAGALRMQAPHPADKEAQGRRSHNYRVPRDKDAFPQPSRTPGPPQDRPAADGAQSSGGKVGPAAAGPQHWQAKWGPGPWELPGPGTPRPARNASPRADARATKEHPSPLGIPYSRLSQSKHLKARMGGGQWASSETKRQAQGPRDCKDP
ncbi:protein FAM83G isoform X3 [Physeter macrocephalus]|uniref:Protein FAM83G isoform X3 n=1 Tax=Physeter macrocephalus TaxID=9755 RepID=A0A9W2X4V9_PHYMC|nr:protein FAM83G isoform X3 [Physeter catodon]